MKSYEHVNNQPIYPDRPSEEELLALVADVQQNRHSDDPARKEAAQASMGRLAVLVEPLIRRVAYKFTRNPDDAEDVMQDSFIRIQKGLGSFEGNSKFTSWAYRVTMSAAIDFIKKRSKYVSVEDILVSHHDNDNKESLDLIYGCEESYEERGLDSKVRWEQLRPAWQKLSPNVQTVLELHTVQDLSYKEIAERLGISESAAKVRVHRGRKSLQEHMEEEQAGNEDGLPKSA